MYNHKNFVHYLGIPIQRNKIPPNEINVFLKENPVRCRSPERK